MAKPRGGKSENDDPVFQRMVKRRFLQDVGCGKVEGVL